VTNALATAMGREPERRTSAPLDAIPVPPPKSTKREKDARTPVLVSVLVLASTVHSFIHIRLPAGCMTDRVEREIVTTSQSFDLY
jgi:hypothetical protein